MKENKGFPVFLYIDKLQAKKGTIYFRQGEIFSRDLFVTQARLILVDVTTIYHAGPKKKVELKVKFKYRFVSQALFSFYNEDCLKPLVL